MKIGLWRLQEIDFILLQFGSENGLINQLTLQRGILLKQIFELTGDPNNAFPHLQNNYYSSSMQIKISKMNLELLVFHGNQKIFKLFHFAEDFQARSLST